MEEDPTSESQCTTRLAGERWLQYEFSKVARKKGTIAKYAPISSVVRWPCICQLYTQLVGRPVTKCRSHSAFDHFIKGLELHVEIKPGCTADYIIGTWLGVTLNLCVSHKRWFLLGDIVDTQSKRRGFI
jgi:hypothetical protein